jgi:hypothetical protein
MAKTLGLLAPLLLALPVVAAACAGAPEGTDASGSALRGLNKTEATAELGQIGDAIRAYYGPLEYKQQRFGFNLDQALADANAEIQAGQTEADFVRPMYKLLGKLHDGHVSFEYPLKGDSTNENMIPMIVMPVEGQYIVAGVNPQLGVTKGDVLVSIDGLSTQKLEELLMPLVQIGTPESSKHFAGVDMTIRPFYAPPELQPQGPTAHVVLKHADGTQYSVDAPWRVTKGGTAGQVKPPVATPPANPATPTHAKVAETFSERANYVLSRLNDPGLDASLMEMGALTPYWLTPQVRQSLALVEVTPKAATLTSFGVTIPPTDATAADADRYIQFRAYKYKFAGKTVMVVRIPSYEVPQKNYDENVAWLASLLKENLAAPVAGATLADVPADVVVLDDTHNPGGSVPYVTGLASLFATAPIPNQVQANHADRKWISQLLDEANQSDATEQPILLDRMKGIETAFDAGKWLAPFTPMVGSFRGPTVPATTEGDLGENMLAAHPQVRWSKPVLVLTDELSGSGGDAFPMLLKNGGVAKTFGAKTMGLGGNVEEVLTLPFSGAKLRLTRGMFGTWKANPSDIPLIENNGVTPTYPYDHTAADFRAGFVDFAKSFSQVAATLTR